MIPGAPKKGEKKLCLAKFHAVLGCTESDSAQYSSILDFLKNLHKYFKEINNWTLDSLEMELFTSKKLV